MPAKGKAEKAKLQEKEAQLVRDGLSLLLMLATDPRMTKEELYEFCVRSRSRVEQELRWATNENLLVKRSFELTRKGRMHVILTFIAIQSGATVDNLERRFKLGRITLAQICGELLQADLVRVAGSLNFEPPLYLATKQGLSLVKQDRLHVVPLSAREEGHQRACIEKGIDFEEEYAPRGAHGYHWETWGERRIAQNNRGKTEEKRFASPAYYMGEVRFYKRPDLLQVRSFRDSRPPVVVAIEVELTSKDDATLDAILWAYFTCPTVDFLDYYVSSLVRKDIERAHTRLQQRIELEIAEGNLPAGTTSNMRVIPLAPSIVPAERRAPFYVPRELPGSQELFRKAVMTSQWRKELHLSVLKVVEWVTKNGVVAPDATAVWLTGRDQHPADELLALGHGAGWLYYSDILRGEGPFFFATEDGRKEVGLILPEYEIDYRKASHHLTTTELCCYSRVAAHLARELPGREIKSRWELRVDQRFSRGPQIEVAGPGEGIGYFRRPHLVALPRLGSDELPTAVIVFASYMQASRISPIFRAYLESEEFGHLYAYVGDADVLRAANKAVEQLGARFEVTIRELPVSPRAHQPVEDDGALRGCSLLSQSRTAWVNT
jgi:hypothetical protein